MAAPDLTQKLTVFVQKEGTDDLGANFPGRPYSRLTIDRALLDLADTTRYPAASSTYFHIVAIGPGTFVLDQLPPPWTFYNGSCDGEGQPTTILLVSADLTLPTAWNVNQTSRGGWANVTFRVDTGAPALDLTMPVPAAGNPTRTIEVFNFHHNLPIEIFEATSLGDNLVKEQCRQFGTSAHTFRQTGGTSRCNNVWSAAKPTIIDKTNFPAAGNWDGLIISDPASFLTVNSVAASGTTLRVSNSSLRALVLSQTAPGVLAVTADVATLPVRAAISVTGTATVDANLTLLNDAQSVAYSPTTPGDWSAPVPNTVQKGLDRIATQTIITALKITYTGTPQEPIFLPFSPGVGLVPMAAVSGQATYQAAAGPALVAINYAEVTTAVSNRNLLTLSFDDLTAVGTSIIFSNFPLLTSLSFPSLVSVGRDAAGGGFNMTGTFPLCTTFSIPVLKTVQGTFTPGGLSALTTLSAPALETVQGAFSPTTFALVTTFNFPLLSTIQGNCSPVTMASLVTLSLPSLAFIGGTFTPSSMAACTTVSLPALVVCNGLMSIPSASMANVASFTLGTVGVTKQLSGATITLSGLKLPSANVNAILALLVSLDGTGGTTLWGAGKTLLINGGTNGAPTGQGIVDKATLIARTATVTTN